jgi:hypothetical protein
MPWLKLWPLMPWLKPWAMPRAHALAHAAAHARREAPVRQAPRFESPTEHGVPSSSSCKFLNT